MNRVTVAKILDEKKTELSDDLASHRLGELVTDPNAPHDQVSEMARKAAADAKKAVDANWCGPLRC